MREDQARCSEPEWMKRLSEDLRFFIDVPFRIAASLYKKLPIDEDDFSRVAAIACEDGRSYFLYGAADEVIKAGQAIMMWGEFLSSPHEGVRDDPEERHIYRVCLERVLDEQRLWQRKLIEWLTNLICFSRTNSQPYYQLFLAAEAYECDIAEKIDLERYYSCDSGNVRVGIGWTVDRLSTDMARVDVDSCWFLRPEVFNGLPQKPGWMFTSMSHRLSTAMHLASAAECLSLGTTYAGGYGRTSRAVHPTIAEPRPPVSVHDARRGLRGTSLLCMHCMRRAHQLAGVEPTGLAKRAFHALETSDQAQLVMRELHQPQLEAGDIVLAYGHLAEVTRKHVSKWGLEAYDVRFLVRGPLEETPEDCVPADRLRPILRKSWSRAFLRYHWEGRSETRDLLSTLDEATDEDLSGLLLPGLIEFERLGIPLAPLVPPEPGDGLEGTDTAPTE